MKFLVVIVFVILLLCIAYFFPKGVKIFGIPAENIFNKKESNIEDLDSL